MKTLLVYEAGGRWFGSETSWDRSGSGFYRQTRPIEIPQTLEGIESLAKEFGYSIEWRGGKKPAPSEPTASIPKAIPTPETAAGLT